jgi:uncharacterized membrane protein
LSTRGKAILTAAVISIFGAVQAYFWVFWISFAIPAFVLSRMPVSRSSQSRGWELLLAAGVIALVAGVVAFFAGAITTVRSYRPETTKLLHKLALILVAATLLLAPWLGHSEFSFRFHLWFTALSGVVLIVGLAMVFLARRREFRETTD